MLGIDMNINIGVKKIESPFYFQHRNECVHCGGVGTLKFVDKFGRLSTKEIHAFDHIQCTRCGKKYSIAWEPKNDESGKLYPSAVNNSIGRDFTNMINTLSLRNNAEKEF